MKGKEERAEEGGGGVTERRDEGGGSKGVSGRGRREWGGWLRVSP